MSQLDCERKEIDGYTYGVMMLSPTKSIDLLVDLSKVIGPAIGHLAGGKQSEDLMETEIDAKFFANAAQALFGNLDKKVLRETIETLGKQTLVDEKPLWPQFEVHFRGKLGTMAKWLAFALGVQYGNFFEAFSGAMSALPSKVGKMAQ